MRIKYIVCIGTVYKCWIMHEYAGRIYVYLLGRMEWLDMRKRYWWLCWSMRKRGNMHRFGKRLSLCLCQRFYRYVFHSSIHSLSLYLSLPLSAFWCILFIYHFAGNSICSQLATVDKWICEIENGTRNGDSLFSR